jgi:hypothetical protein
MKSHKAKIDTSARAGALISVLGSPSDLLVVAKFISSSHFADGSLYFHALNLSSVSTATSLRKLFAFKGSCHWIRFT